MKATIAVVTVLGLAVTLVMLYLASKGNSGLRLWALWSLAVTAVLIVVIRFWLAILRFIFTLACVAGATMTLLGLRKTSRELIPWGIGLLVGGAVFLVALRGRSYKRIRMKHGPPIELPSSFKSDMEVSMLKDEVRGLKRDVADLEKAEKSRNDDSLSKLKRNLEDL